MLLSNGADARETPLLIATRGKSLFNDRLEIVSLLLEHGADANCKSDVVSYYYYIN